MNKNCTDKSCSLIKRVCLHSQISSDITGKQSGHSANYSHTHRQTDRQTDSHIRQTDRLTDKQSPGSAHRNADTHEQICCDEKAESGPDGCRKRRWSATPIRRRQVRVSPDTGGGLLFKVC